MELLESFRSLGIEIHNVFGVTEAPLITLSRLGENELRSVGALLPETEAHIGADGQVYVRGPQVTRGYDGADGSAVDDEPFTTALLWLEDDIAERIDFSALDDAVRSVNQQLSHPEQVKRRVVASRPLSIGAFAWMTSSPSSNTRYRRQLDIAPTSSCLLQAV
jgi:hypothetical protein